MTTKRYCITYLSPGGIHYHFRCYAENKREARKECRVGLGIKNKDIVEIREEGTWI